MPPDHVTSATKPEPVSTWAPLAIRMFRALWIAGLVSDVGAWMHGVGEGWLMTIASEAWDAEAPARAAAARV